MHIVKIVLVIFVASLFVAEKTYAYQVGRECEKLWSNDQVSGDKIKFYLKRCVSSFGLEEYIIVSSVKFDQGYCYFKETLVDSLNIRENRFSENLKITDPGISYTIYGYDEGCNKNDRLISTYNISHQNVLLIINKFREMVGNNEKLKKFINLNFITQFFHDEQVVFVSSMSGGNVYIYSISKS